jgi:hypothetical protein
MIPIPSQEYIDAIPKEDILPSITKEQLYEASIDAEVTFYFRTGRYAQ